MIKLPKNPIPMLKAAWERSRQIPFGSKVFSKVFGQAVPYTGSISPDVLEVEPGRAKVGMKDRRAVRNHLNCIHAMAQANLGEAATGLALNFALPDTHRAILVGFEIEYVKKARGDLTATCTTVLPDDLDDKDVVVTGMIQNTAHEVVSKVKATWRTGRV